MRAAWATANDVNTGEIAAANEAKDIPVEIRKARIAALTADTTLGDWLEEAIEEKVKHEKEKDDVASADS